MIAMPVAVKLGFTPYAAPASGVLIMFCGEGVAFGSATRRALADAAELVTLAAKAEHFTGKSGSSLDIVMPAGLKASRLVIIGAGKTAALQSKDITRLGGAAMGKVPSSATEATIFAELPGGAIKAKQAAELALGVKLRAYTFDRYKTKRKDDDDRRTEVKVSIAVADVAAANKAFSPREALGNGVMFARDLVNEPANILYPE